MRKKAPCQSLYSLESKGQCHLCLKRPYTKSCFYLTKLNLPHYMLQMWTLTVSGWIWHNFLLEWLSLHLCLYRSAYIGWGLRLFRFHFGMLLQIMCGKWIIGHCVLFPLDPKCFMLSSCFHKGVTSSPLPCFLSLPVTGDLTTDRLRDRNKIHSHSREREKLSGCLRRLVALTFIWSTGIGCSQTRQVL